MPHPRHEEEGQSLAELALLMPTLLFILVGVLDLGRAFQAYITVINAAREGARYASYVYPFDTLAIRDQIVQEAAGSGIDLSDSVILIDWNGEVGEPVQVTVTYDFQPVTGLLLGGQTIPIHGSSTIIRF